MKCFAARSDDDTLAIRPIAKEDLDSFIAERGSATASWIKRHGFNAKPGSTLTVPDDEGKPSLVLLGVSNEQDLWSWGGAAKSLPEGTYRVEPEPDAEAAHWICLGWALGAYRFDRYTEKKEDGARLLWPENADRKAITAEATGVWLTRDLVNTPASDMGPGELAGAAAQLARDFDGTCATIVGDDLLRENFPMIHAVGRASDRQPRLIDLTWGNEDAPKLTLVGKGVCFDTGGLDLKPSSAMLQMKKDMGGAAQALGLAHMIMANGLPVRLRVLIPAVENSVSGNAFRPLDILSSRKGLSVEIGNTDAEGRLVLADALALACEEGPDLLIDFATLTGAARVALGPDLPAMFTNDDTFAAEALHSAEAGQDPIWRMPLHDAYDTLLDSKVADLNNVSSGPFAGAITAALFLRRFVEKGIPWAHFDLMSWNTSAKPGRPEGGEAQAIRGVWRYLKKRYA